MTAWPIRPLEEVAAVNYGTRVTRKQDAGSRYPVYGGGGATFAMDVSNRDSCYIVARFGMSEQCVRYVDGPFFLNDSGLTVDVLDARIIEQRFLDTWLLASQPEIYALGRGTAQKNLNVDAFKRLLVPIPPLVEQKRIVAVLDQAFAALDGARALAEENLADAEKLFENVLEQRLSGLYQTYPVRRLIDLCGERGVTYGVIKLGDHIPDGVPCLRTSNVRPLAIETDGMKRITTSLSNEYKRTILKGGEVLVNVRGTLGGVAVVPPEMAGWNISREVAMVDILGVNPSYIAYSIATKRAQSWLTGVTKGAAYKGINLTDLRELEIPAVDGDLQDRLVGELNDLERTCTSVAASFKSKLQDIDHLRHCLLQKALAGELT